MKTGQVVAIVLALLAVLALNLWLVESMDSYGFQGDALYGSE